MKRVGDPMHGNGKTSATNPDVKTRHMCKLNISWSIYRFDEFSGLLADIVTEISKSITIHNSLGSKLQGIHLELTGELNEDGYSVTGEMTL
jgi:3-deoxy-7-phosphoheptulonate synthase